LQEKDGLTVKAENNICVTSFEDMKVKMLKFKKKTDMQGLKAQLSLCLTNYPPSRRMGESWYGSIHS
jgi:hypothetical protein